MGGGGSICPSFSSLNEHDLVAHAVLFTFFLFPLNAMQCSVQFVAEYWYWLPEACVEGDGGEKGGFTELSSKTRKL